MYNFVHKEKEKLFKMYKNKKPINVFTCLIKIVDIYIIQSVIFTTALRPQQKNTTASRDRGQQ